MDFLVELLGQSPGVVGVRETVERLLSGRLEGRRLPPVLILGETGTGKGLLARGLHRASVRAGGPLVDVNCAAIPETLLESELFGFERGAFTDARQAKAGLFQAAHHGTIFLDEIGLLSPALQAKLLKVLEDRTVRRLGSTRSEPVDVWVVSASNEDLAASIRERRFREDLYHRLAVITLTLPPLRARGDDIVLLAEHFLTRACADYGLSPIRLSRDARAALTAYRWPGNVRELSNVIERAALVADGPTLGAEHLGPPVTAPDAPPALGVVAGDAPRRQLAQALAETGGNISRTAGLLGVTRNTVKARMARYGLRPVEDGEAAPAARDAPSPSGPASEGLRWERRWITALRVAVRAPIEANVYQLAPLLGELMTKAQSFGARVEDLHPRGFTAFFGLDPMEQAAARAVIAALAIRKAIARVGSADAGGGASVVLHATEALVARGASGVGMDPADRQHVRSGLDALAAACPAESVGVSHSAARFLERRFDLAPLDDAAAGYRVRGPARSGFEVGDRESPFVGRGGELTRLQEALAAAERGEGQIVGLVGEAGAGKSRLVHEFRATLGHDRVTFLEGRCLAYGASTPYLPIIDLLRHAFGFDEADARDTIGERVTRGVDALGLASASITPYLLHVLGPGGAADGPLARLSPETARLRAMDALRQLVIAASQLRPVVIVLEDVHWIDPTSADSLAALADSAAGCRLLIVTTSRPGQRPPWVDRSYATQLVLRRLGREDSLRIIEAIVPDAAVRDEVAERLVAKAQGIPFFLEELARTVADRGPARALAEIPDTIQDAIAARVDRLPLGDRDCLQAAAVIGREGAVSVLREIAGLGEPAFSETLGRLRAADFLRDTRIVPAPEYAFAHVLTQDVAYRGLAPDRRRALHASAASAIDRLLPHVAERAPEVLAHHCAEAGLAVEAIGYWHRAGQLASRRSAHAEAIEHLSKGLALIETLPETPDRMQKELGLRLGLVASLIETGGFASMTLDATLARARDLVRQLGGSPQLFPVRFAVWRLSMARAQMLAADETATSLLEIAERASDRALSMAAHVAIGVTAYYRGQFGRSRSHLERSLTFHEPPFGAAQVLAYGHDLGSGALGYLGSSQVIAGDVDQAAVSVDRGLDAARRSEHPFTLAFALMLAAFVYQLRRDRLTTKRLGDELSALARDQGFVFFQGIALNLVGWGEAAGTLTAAAIDTMREGARGHDRLGHRLGMTYRTNLAETLVRAGAVDEACGILEATLAHSSDTGEQSHLADIHRVKGEALVALARHADARASFGLAFDLATKQGARLFALRAATASVKLSVITGGRAPAADLARLADVYATFTEGLDLDDLRAARELLG